MENKETYSHAEILHLIQLFGLTVDYDQWEVEGKNWIRVVSKDWPNEFGFSGRKNCLILYKEDGKEILLGELQMSLINLGENLKAKKLRELLSIE
jgi:hypothetical protein